MQNVSTRRRRFYRLALATAAALLFHLGLVLSGNWGMNFLTVPSNEDRLITLSLERALSEGLKESPEKVQETVNTPNIGKPLTQNQPLPQNPPRVKTPSNIEPNTQAAAKATDLLQEGVSISAPEDVANEERISEELASDTPATGQENQAASSNSTQAEKFEIEQLEIEELDVDQQSDALANSAVESIAEQMVNSSSHSQAEVTDEAQAEPLSQANTIEPKDYYFARQPSELRLPTFHSGLSAPDSLPEALSPLLRVPASQAPLKETKAPSVHSAAVAASIPEQASQFVTLSAAKQRALENKIQQVLRHAGDVANLRETVNWKYKGQEFEAKFHPSKADSDMGIDELKVEVATEQDGEYLTTTLHLKKLVFSNFAQFVDHWEPNTVIHDDQMDGRFHSNTQINFSSSRRVAPVFYGKVTTAASGINKQGLLRKADVFVGGLETRVKRIAMPKARLLMPQNNHPQPDGRASQVFIVEQNSRLTFNRNGYVLVQPVGQAGPPRQYVFDERSNYIIAAPKTVLHVRGVVNGLVSVYSPKRIVIEGNVTYEKYASLADGGDFLGLISGANVMVAGRNVIGPGDLEIHASIYARSRFGIKEIRGKRSGTLSILGSLSVGTLTATEPRYATKISFDQRLQDVRPPSFPVTDRYELLAQERQWQVEESPFHDMQDTELLPPDNVQR